MVNEVVIEELKDVAGENIAEKLAESIGETAAVEALKVPGLKKVLIIGGIIFAVGSAGYVMVGKIIPAVVKGAKGAYNWGATQIAKARNAYYNKHGVKSEFVDKEEPKEENKTEE